MAWRAGRRSVLYRAACRPATRRWGAVNLPLRPSRVGSLALKFRSHWGLMRAFAIRVVVFAVMLALVPAVVRAQDGSLAGEWLKYRGRFVENDGRVRDTGNKDVSHTEGQGLAMLFAEACDDRAAFDRV